MNSIQIDRDRVIQFTCELVRIPSLSGEEQVVSRRVEEEFRTLDFDRVWTDANGSVIGVIEGEQPGKTLLFDAHTDTVGISPGVPWQHQPFGAQIDGNAIYGRGAADMKGALAAMVYAMASIDRSQLKGRIVLSASTLEEVLEGVALKEVMDVIHPDFVVIGESTNFNVARGGRGRAEVHLKTIGLPSHSSAPEQGRNAVLDMMRVISSVQNITLPEDPFLGKAIFALTDIISEPYPGNSVIPSICRVTYDRRVLPGETPERVLTEITARPELQDIRLEATIGVGEYHTYTGTVLRCDKFFPAWQYAETDPFISAALGGLHAVGIPAKTHGYRFCTNAAYSAGVAGIPTLGFGPATEADAHVIDEHLQIEELLAVAKGYQAIIQAVLQ